MFTILRRLAPLLLAVASLSPALAKAPPPAHPALWKIKRGPATIYLFGTIHLLPAGQQWRDKAIDAAVARSGSLSLEIVADRPADLARVATAFAALAYAEGLPPLAERVPPARREALAKLIAETGMPAAAFDRMKTWAAAVLLTGPAMNRLGLVAGSGVEPQISALFRAGGKPVGELETPAQQLGYFDGLPESAQRIFLAQTLEDTDEARADFGRMLAAWAKADVPGIERAFADDPEFTPELRAILLRRRDEAWADALEKRLETPGVSFVAVGAGHLVGPDSVQAMLAKKGIATTRVQ